MNIQNHLKKFNELISNQCFDQKSLDYSQLENHISFLKQFADELFLSINTVNNHRRNILEKTQSENTTMAIRYGISLGLLRLANIKLF